MCNISRKFLVSHSCDIIKDANSGHTVGVIAVDFFEYGSDYTLEI